MRHEKLSPGLLLAYEDYQREGAQGLTTQKRSLGIMGSRYAMQETKSIVFIFCDEDADLRPLLQQGIEVNQNTGSVRTAY
ncbi:MAG: peptidase S8, partial [Tolypothrix sp. Co-bin9]|nr:peptidase S8 [Tolypothrix sp. Co-bin9]